MNLTGKIRSWTSIVTISNCQNWVRIIFRAWYLFRDSFQLTMLKLDVEFQINWKTSQRNCRRLPEIRKRTSRFETYRRIWHSTHKKGTSKKKKNLSLSINQTNAKGNKTTCPLTCVPVVGHYIGIRIYLTGIRSA